MVTIKPVDSNNTLTSSMTGDSGSEKAYSNRSSNQKRKSSYKEEYKRRKQKFGSQLEKKKRERNKKRKRHMKDHERVAIKEKLKNFGKSLITLKCFGILFNCTIFASYVLFIILLLMISSKQGLDRTTLVRDVEIQEEVDMWLEATMTIQSETAINSQYGLVQTDSQIERQLLSMVKSHNKGSHIGPIKLATIVKSNTGEYVGLYNTNKLIIKNSTAHVEHTRDLTNGNIISSSSIITADEHNMFTNVLNKYYEEMKTKDQLISEITYYKDLQGIWALNKLVNQDNVYTGFLGSFITLEQNTEFSSHLIEHIHASSARVSFHGFGISSKKQLFTNDEGEAKYILENILSSIKGEDMKEEHQVVHTSSQKAYKAFVPRYETTDGNTAIMDIVIISARDISLLATFENMDIVVFILNIVGVFIICIIYTLVSFFGSYIITYIAKNLTHVSNLEFEKITGIPIYLFCFKPLAEFKSLDNGMSVVRNGLLSFSKYVPISVVEQIILEKSATELGMTSSRMTILFIDIEGFTSLSERCDSQVFLDQLSDYFGVISDLVEGYEGVVDKYIGDAIMAWWNHRYKPVKKHELRACEAVLQIFHRLQELNIKWAEQDLPTLGVRCGLNTGEVKVGNMGSKDRLNYTCIGDAVNIASRLEAVNKYFGTRCLIGPETYRGVQADILCQWVDIVALKGKMKGIDLYTMVDHYEYAKGFDQELARELLEIRKQLIRRNFSMMKSLVKASCSRPQSVPKHLQLLKERADTLSQIGECKDVDVTLVMASK